MLSDKWTLLQFRTACRTELLDPNGKWFTDTELNDYINKWQTDVQNYFEFVWGSATVTTNTATLTLTNIATNLLRLDAIYWNLVRLTPKTLIGMDNFRREWRGVVGTNNPQVAYQPNLNVVSFYPPPGATGTAIFEHPVIVTSLTADTNTSDLPAWTRYSAINYVAARAYQRAGPRQDIQRAQQYKNMFMADMNQLRLIKDQYQPEKYLSIRPPGTYERQILQPDMVLIK